MDWCWTFPHLAVTSFHIPAAAAIRGYKHLLHLITDMPPALWVAAAKLTYFYVSKTEADAIKRGPEEMLGFGSFVINYKTPVDQLYQCMLNSGYQYDDESLSSLP